MMRLTAIALALAVFAVTAQEAPVRGLTAAPRLARAYDAVLDARFDDVPQLVQQACPPAPAEACQLLDTVALWWQIQLDPLNPSRDEAFIAKADAAIAAAEAWTVREPLRAEAWFYLGGAYGARVQFRSLRRELLSAARDGKRIKASLEQALALDPAMHDAYFGIGLYHYYADVAPTALKMLRWLLLLPGGDREQGLQEMLRARNRGELARSEADYQLQLLYIWYEKQPARALEILAELRSRHPHNPHFLQLIAETHDVYLLDPAASLKAWQVLLDQARRRSVAEPAMAEATARLGLALQLDRLDQDDAAIAHLRAVIAARPPAPYGALARAHLQLADILAQRGRREEAVSAYHTAIAAAPPDDPMKIRARANAQLRYVR
jgi:tetratricopeptide (TPR) repeat protein